MAGLSAKSEYDSVDGKRIKFASKLFRDFDPMRTANLLAILEKGSDQWNNWRLANPLAYIDLRSISLLGKNVSLLGANLREANLGGAHLGGVDLRGADLSAAYMYKCILQGAKLQNANLQGSYLSEADLSVANLTGADLRLANLSWAGMMLVTLDNTDLRKAKLHSSRIISASCKNAIAVEADLSDAVLRDTDFTGTDFSMASLNGASLVEADLSRTNLNGCHVYGTSVWKSNLENAQQSNLVITPNGEPSISIDNLKVAQFIYLLLNNSEIRNVIDTITSKIVLILGRFSAERKVVLDIIRDELRSRDYLPILFDFEKSESKSFIDTVSILAHLARFVIADVTDAKVVLQELQRFVPDLPSVPVQPLLLQGSSATTVLTDFMNYPWFLELHYYKDQKHLLDSLSKMVIAPAEAKIAELADRRKKFEARFKVLGKGGNGPMQQ